jgi:tetratricopeptide (TPR) repeat protein
MPSILTMLRQYGITVALLLAGTSAHAQDTPATRTVQPTPLPSTDATLKTTSPEAAPIDAQGELTLEGGIAALNDGRYTQAAAAFERAIAAQGESAMLYALLGRARLLAGEHGAAQVALRRATQLEPNTAKYSLWYGHTLRAGGDMGAAANAYHNALVLEPGNAQAQAALRDLSSDRTSAEQPSQFPDATNAPHDVWYGWQTLVVDGAAVLLGVAGAVLAVSSSSGESAGVPVASLGVITYFLGGPSVHVAHNNLGRGLGSLGLRIGVPIVGGAIGCAANDRSGEFRCLAGFVIGAALGAVPAVIIDAGVLAWSTEEQESEPGSTERAGFDLRVFATPTPSRDGMVAGVSGRM